MTAHRAPVASSARPTAPASWPAKPGVIRFLVVAPIRAVMVDGEGRPGEATFGARMPGLYTTAYDLRFALKRRGVERRVGMLEGLYWTSDGRDRPRRDPRPGARDLALDAPHRPAGRGDRRGARGLAGEGPLEGGARTIAPNLRIETFDEGAVAQVLHLGPYAEERPTIERLHAAIAAAGLRPRGRHHELYLGDPTRSEAGEAAGRSSASRSSDQHELAP